MRFHLFEHCEPESRNCWFLRSVAGVLNSVGLPLVRYGILPAASGQRPTTRSNHRLKPSARITLEKQIMRRSWDVWLRRSSRAIRKNVFHHHFPRKSCFCKSVLENGLQVRSFSAPMVSFQEMRKHRQNKRKDEDKVRFQPKLFATGP